MDLTLRASESATRTTEPTTVRSALNLMRERLAGAGEGEAPARGARRHADGPAQPPFLVDRCRMRNERPRLGLDREGACDVAQPRADLDSGARLGVASVRGAVRLPRSG